ncbi:MAG: site-2 protease family protein [Nitrospirae bacterium]|nr:site-2 protease family protein [Nitrospirota bacterium]
MPHKLTKLHILLFILTVITTLFAGAMMRGVIPWQNPEKIYLGIPFSATLLTILMTHELSHYFVSRRHNVSVTLPYFIPAPSMIGTFGAIIKMRPPIYDKRSLIDIGSAGPLGGFVVAVAAVIIGLSYSEIIPVGKLPKEGFSLGSSLLFSFLAKLVLNIDMQRYDVVLHPVAFAGWIGLFVTSVNLLPLGQLDGGHIAYAVFGERQPLIARIVIGILIILGFTTWEGWIVWAPAPFSGV